jgi:c-di-GMP-binding flagellar brake protein YcgR
MSALGDRRSCVRLEVVGALRGTLELTATARVVNISQTGALIQSPLAVPLDSIQIVHFNVDGEDVPVEALIRHVRHAESSDDYLVGVQFMSAPITLLHNIEQRAPDPGFSV